MKIATWNVNGIRARESQFVDWIAEEKPDVICLQETKAPPDKVPETIVALDGYVCRWHGVGGYSGVALHARTGSSAAAAEFGHPPFDFESRVITADIDNLQIMSVYVPNGGKDFDAKMRFLGDLRDHVRSVHAAGRHLVICGDINIAHRDIDVHPKERKPGKAIGQLPEEREMLDSILSSGLVDLGRHFDPDNEELFTWWAPWRNLRQRNIGWRIDYILVSKPLVARSSGCAVRRMIGTSDHAPVVATIDL